MVYEKGYRPPPQQERRRDPRFAGGPGADFVARVAIWVTIGFGFLGYSSGGEHGAKIAAAFGAVIMFIVAMVCECSGMIEYLKEANYPWMRWANQVMLLAYFALACAVLVNAN